MSLIDAKPIIVSGTSRIRIRFDYAGTEMILGPGDCIQFESSFEHNGVAIDGKEAKAFVVITPDKKP